MNRVLIYKPQGKARLKKSVFYGLSIAAKTIGLSSEYLFQAIVNNADVKKTDEYIDMFWREHFDRTFTTLYATGQKHLLPGETYIFMSNHESWMDIPAMFGAAPKSLRMVAKAGLMKIPVLGHAMANAGFVAIDRKNRNLAIKQLDEAKKRLLEGISIWISPEGTRTRDGSIGPFKKGGFYLAKDLKTPIVPVFIEGARDVMPPDSLAIKPNQSITVHFLPPLSVREIDNLSIPDLVAKVRESIIDKQKECKRENYDAS